METCSNYIDLSIGGDLNAYWLPSNRYKTLRFDVVLRHRLQRLDNTRVALIGRLCERGTNSMPDMRSLNRYIDDLYGAYFSVEVVHMGDQQLIHLCLEVIDERFVDNRAHGDILRRAVRFLRSVLTDPLREDGGYKRSYLEQEKRALTLQTESLYNDKVSYAQWRCAEEMGRGTAWGLSHLGTPDDLAAIDAVDLWTFHQQLLAQNPVDIFVSGYIERDLAAAMCREIAASSREPVLLPTVSTTPVFEDSCRRLFEFQDIIQGKLVLGYDTGIGLGSEDYAAQVLFNLTWASDSQSSLFRRLREELGLCYYIDSHVDSLAGFVYTAAGIETGNYDKVMYEIEAELNNMRSGGAAIGDLENGKKMLKSRLVSILDDRQALMHLRVRAIIAGKRYEPEELLQEIEAVDAEQISRVAKKMKLRTAFFLHGRRDQELRRA